MLCDTFAQPLAHDISITVRREKNNKEPFDSAYSLLQYCPNPCQSHMYIYIAMLPHMYIPIHSYTTLIVYDKTEWRVINNLPTF